MQTGRVSNARNGGHLAADQLVTTHLWLVRAVAKKVLDRLPSHVELNDLIEDGVFGLIAAAQRYDPARGVSFPLYAKHRIRGAIVDGLRRMDHLSRDSRSKAKKSEQERDPSSARLAGLHGDARCPGERNRIRRRRKRRGTRAGRRCGLAARRHGRPRGALGDAAQCNENASRPVQRDRRVVPLAWAHHA